MKYNNFRLSVPHPDDQRDPAAAGGRAAARAQGEVVEAHEGRRPVRGRGEQRIVFYIQAVNKTQANLCLEAILSLS